MILTMQISYEKSQSHNNNLTLAPTTNITIYNIIFQEGHISDEGLFIFAGVATYANVQASL